MANILIVSNSYYPEITPRAFRTVELAKEFARRGEKVTVLLPNREIYHDNTLNIKGVKVIYGTGEPERKGEGNVRKNKKIRRFMPSWLQKIILYFYNHELFIKYNKGIYERLSQLGQKFDAIISISYPAAIHLAVSRAMKSNPDLLISPTLHDNVKIAEFSDPPFKGDFARGVFPAYYSYLKKWGRQFDYFVTPVDNAVQCYAPYIGKNRVKVIPQGFDMSAIKKVVYKPYDIPTFAYAGRFYENIRDPRYFFDFLKSVDTDFRFDLYLNHLNPYFSEMVESARQQAKGEIVVHEALPREELLQKLSGYDFLVNFENTTSNATPSKLIDYAIAGRPVLSFGEKNFDRGNFEAALRGDYSGQAAGIDLEEYDIKNIVAKFLELISGSDQKKKR